MQIRKELNRGGRGNTLFFIFLFLFFLKEGSYVFAESNLPDETKEQAISEAFREIKMNETLAVTSALNEAERGKEATGEKLLPFILARTRPHFILDFSQDDNIYQIPQKTGGFVTGFDMGLKFSAGLLKPSSGIETNKMDLDIGISTFTYAGKGELDRQKPYASLDLAIGKGKRKLEFSQSFKQSSEVLSDLIVGATGLVDSSKTATRLRYEYNFKYFAYALGLSRTNYDYEGQYNPTNTYHTYGFSLTGFLKPLTMPKTRFLLELAYEKGEYVKSPVTDNNYDDLTTWLGIEGKVAPKVTGLAKLGWEKRDYRSAHDSTSFSAKINLDYAFSPLTSFKLRIQRLGQQTTVIGENLDQNLTFNLGALHKLSFNKNLGLSLDFSYSKDNYFGGRVDNKYGFSPSLQYAFRQWLNFKLGYTYKDISSTASGVGYTQGIYSFTTTAVF